jgi:hypothetical protein
MNFTAVNNSVFQGCSSLQSVTIPKSIQGINNRAFQDCSSLTEVTFMGNIPAISSNNFTNTNDTAYYDVNSSNKSILPSFFTNLVPLNPSKPLISNVTVSGQTATIYLEATSDININYSWSIDGITYTPFSPIQSTSPLQIGGLTTGTYYTFRVKAIGRVYSSDASEPYGPVLLVDQPPEAPGIINVNGASPTRLNPTVSISFANPFNTSITNYSYSINGETPYTDLSPSQTSSPLIIPATGLISGTSYTFQIKAINMLGSSSASTSVSRTFYMPPLAPTITSVNGNPENKNISISFANPSDTSITNYSYIINGKIPYNVLSPSQSSNPLTIPPNGLNSRSSSTFRIKAINISGSSSESDEFSSTITIPISTPVINRVSYVSGLIKCYYTQYLLQETGVTGFKYSIDNGETYTFTNSTANPLVISGLKPGITYPITLIANNGSDSTPSTPFDFIYYIRIGNKP